MATKSRQKKTLSMTTTTTTTLGSLFQFGDIKKEIVRAVRENAVVVILGVTGSGKTTQIAQMLYENMEELLVVDKEGNGETKRRRRENGIAVTQPRRVAAISSRDACTRRCIRTAKAKIWRRRGWIFRAVWR